MSCVNFCFSGWVVYMVSHGVFQGLSSNQASLLPTSFGIGYILGKFMEPLLDHTRFKLSTCTWVYLGCVLMSASYLTEAFMTLFPVQMIVTCFIGIGHGIVSQSNDVIVRFLTSGDRIVAVVCWQALIGGVCGMGSGLLTGWYFCVVHRFATFMWDIESGVCSPRRFPMSRVHLLASVTVIMRILHTE